MAYSVQILGLAGAFVIRPSTVCIQDEPVCLVPQGAHTSDVSGRLFEI